ncbi:AbrB family transcriptional regulator [Pigmentiphaga sp.]|uniref:AbrB family transcriptional regulator n=1 Tax=Pigmentiphaga sp. TaxID=1977564 RepID=UPI0029C9C672|nr:AbrB family transcriptional regulator [Pigmentiphaga sp.]
MPRFSPMPARLLLGFAIALCGSLIAVALHTPLPWMLGALVATAASKIGGVRSESHVALRCAGQWVIGLGLGLYFTPTVVDEIAGNVIPLVAGALFAVLIGLAGACFLRRAAGVEFSTAYFSSTIGGAAEMANLSDRYGGKVSLVASAHSLRILLVVVLVPLGFRFSGITGTGLFPPATLMVDLPGLALMFALTGCGALLARRVGMPNAWVLGPMAVTIALTSQDMAFSALPGFLLNGAQLLIGWSLGDRYTPDFFRIAPRFMASILVYTLIAIVLAVGASVALAPATGISSPTLILGLAPGGVAEMCITAKVLQLGVPLVTAFQVFRLAAVLLVSGPLYRGLLKHFPALREGSA